MLYKEDNQALPLLLGTNTQWGEVSAIACIEGERYYFMVDKLGIVSMMPSCVVEDI